MRLTTMPPQTQFGEFFQIVKPLPKPTKAGDDLRGEIDQFKSELLPLEFRMTSEKIPFFIRNHLNTHLNQAEATTAFSVNVAVGKDDVEGSKTLKAHFKAISQTIRDEVLNFQMHRTPQEREEARDLFLEQMYGPSAKRAYHGLLGSPKQLTLQEFREFVHQNQDRLKQQ
jgi:hypothetical protein